jgi:hypothetical protein
VIASHILAKDVHDLGKKAEFGHSRKLVLISLLVVVCCCQHRLAEPRDLLIRGMVQYVLIALLLLWPPVPLLWLDELVDLLLQPALARCIVM